MAHFSISLSIEVDVANYDEAYELEKSIIRALQADPEIMNVYSIDVEQQDGFEEEVDDSED